MENKIIVENYFSFLQQGALEKLGALFADKVIWHQPGKGELSGRYEGKEAVFTLFGEFMKRSQGTFRIDSVADIMANGDWVTATLRFSASRGDKRSISMSGVDLMKVENGQIVEVRLFSADQDGEDRFWGNNQ